METHIFICGAKSLGQYGGYETFVDKLTQYHQGRTDLHYHIICKANGSGCMDESKLEGVEKLSDGEFMYHNAHCVKLKVPNIGPAVAIYYDYIAMNWCIRYCKEHKIQKPIFYLLTCRIGPLMRSMRRRVHALGGVLYDNPDGHEWMRSKWAPPIQKYWKFSEKLTVKSVDLLVCDSRYIESYIQETYASVHPKTTYVAYGAELTPSPLSDGDERFVNWLSQWNTRPFDYYLVVGRCVPEDNFETIIREFMRTSTHRSLLLVTDNNEGLLAKLEENLHYSADPRVHFCGTVYDEPLLQKIRENAFAYFHGHEVGGTNPSLLEALAATKLNLILGVKFNREVGQDAALYWEKDEGSLCALIGQAEKMPPEEIEALGRKAKKRVEEAYRWQMIADQYADLWRKATEEKKA